MVSSKSFIGVRAYAPQLGKFVTQIRAVCQDYIRRSRVSPKNGRSVLSIAKLGPTTGVVVILVSDHPGTVRLLPCVNGSRNG